MVRDVRSRLRCVRLRPSPFGIVATGNSYRSAVPTVGSVHSAHVEAQAAGVVGASVGPAGGRAADPGVPWPDELEALVRLRPDLLLVPQPPVLPAGEDARRSMRALR